VTVSFVDAVTFIVAAGILAAAVEESLAAWEPAVEVGRNPLASVVRAAAWEEPEEASGEPPEAGRHPWEALPAADNPPCCC